VSDIATNIYSLSCKRNHLSGKKCKGCFEQTISRSYEERCKASPMVGFVPFLELTNTQTTEISSPEGNVPLQPFHGQPGTITSLETNAVCPEELLSFLQVILGTNLTFPVQQAGWPCPPRATAAGDAPTSLHYSALFRRRRWRNPRSGFLT
jgi:hypothetical protein